MLSQDKIKDYLKNHSKGFKETLCILSVCKWFDYEFAQHLLKDHDNGSSMDYVGEIITLSFVFDFETRGWAVSSDWRNPIIDYFKNEDKELFNEINRRAADYYFTERRNNGYSNPILHRELDRKILYHLLPIDIDSFKVELINQQKSISNSVYKKAEWGSLSRIINKGFDTNREDTPTEFIFTDAEYMYFSRNYNKALKFYLKIINKNMRDIIHSKSAHRIGCIYWNQDKFDKSIDMLTKSVGICRESGEKDILAEVLNTIGVVLRSKGGIVNLENAEKCLEESVKIAESQGMLSQEVISLKTLVDVLKDLYKNQNIRGE